MTRHGMAASAIKQSTLKALIRFAPHQLPPIVMFQKPKKI